MTKLQKTMKHLDRQAAESGDAAGFWQSASLLLAIWSAGAIPAAGYSTYDHPELFRAAKKLGAELRTAVDARAFPI